MKTRTLPSLQQKFGGPRNCAILHGSSVDLVQIYKLYRHLRKMPRRETNRRPFTCTSSSTSVTVQMAYERVKKLFPTKQIFFGIVFLGILNRPLVRIVCPSPESWRVRDAGSKWLCGRRRCATFHIGKGNSLIGVI